MPAPYVRTLAVGPDGTAWLGTGDGLAVVQNGKIVPHAMDILKSVPDVYWSFRAILPGADGEVLLGTRTALLRVKGTRVEKLSGTASLPNAVYTALLRQSDGRVWIGSTRGLFCLSPDGRIEAFGAAQGLTASSIECIHLDRDGNLWVGTTAGLFRRTAERFEMALYPSAFGDGHIGQITETAEGALLISSNAGLFQLRDTPVSVIANPDSLKPIVANTLMQTHDGAILLGLWTGGIYRYDRGRGEVVAAVNPSETGSTFSLCEEADDTVWIGGEDGLLRYANGKAENFYLGPRAVALRKRLTTEPDLVLPGVVHPIVKSIITDGEGGLWIATDGALYHERGGEFRVVPKTLGVNLKSVWRDRHGDI